MSASVDTVLKNMNPNQMSGFKANSKPLRSQLLNKGNNRLITLISCDGRSQK